MTGEEQYSRSWNRPFARQVVLLQVDRPYGFVRFGVPDAIVKDVSPLSAHNKIVKIRNAGFIFRILLLSCNAFQRVLRHKGFLPGHSVSPSLSRFQRLPNFFPLHHELLEIGPVLFQIEILALGFLYVHVIQ